MSTSRRGTILVVDDEEIMREILDTLLTREGYDVRAASSGAEGLELARALPFDAAIVDIMMPGLDGFEVVRRLRGEDRHVPVLFLTARDAVEDKVLGLHTGGDDYVTKPFSLDELVARQLLAAVEPAALAASLAAVAGVERERPGSPASWSCG